MILSLKPSSLSRLPPTCSSVVTERFRSQVNNLFNNSIALTLSPCVSLIPFDLKTELTEYQRQGVFRSAVPLGC